MALPRGVAAALAVCFVVSLPAAVYLVQHGASLLGSPGGERRVPGPEEPLARLLQELEGPAGSDQWLALSLHASLGDILRDAGRHAEAAEQYLKAREIAGAYAKDGKNQEEVSKRLLAVQSDLGVAYLRQGKLQDAKRELEGAWKLADPKGPEASRLLQMLGNVRRDSGKVEEALLFYARAAKLPRADVEDSASLMNDLGQTHQIRGELDEAMAIFREAARVPASGAGGAEAAAALGNIGGVFHLRGDAAAALAHYQRSLRAQELFFHSAHPDLALTRVAIARAQRDLGDSRGAMRSVLGAEALLRGRDAETSLPMATVLNVKGDLLREAGRPGEGETAIRDALTIQLRVFGTESNPEMASTLNTLGSTLHDQHRYAEALVYYQRALKASLESTGEWSPDAAVAHNNLGNLYQDLGNDRQAQEEFTKTLEIQLRTVGAESPDVSASYNNLATVLFRQGKVDRAEKLLAKAIAVADKAKLPMNSPDRQVYVENHQAALEELRMRSRQAASKLSGGVAKSEGEAASKSSGGVAKSEGEAPIVNT